MCIDPKEIDPGVGLPIFEEGWSIYPLPGPPPGFFTPRSSSPEPVALPLGPASDSDVTDDSATPPPESSSSKHHKKSHFSKKKHGRGNGNGKGKGSTGVPGTQLLKCKMCSTRVQKRQMQRDHQHQVGKEERWGQVGPGLEASRGEACAVVGMLCP